MLKVKHSLKLQTETEFQVNLDQEISDGRGTLKRLSFLKFSQFNRITNNDMLKWQREDSRGN